MVSLPISRQSVQEKENSEFKPIVLYSKLTLCHILLMVERLDKYIPPLSAKEFLIIKALPKQQSLV